MVGLDASHDWIYPPKAREYPVIFSEFTFRNYIWRIINTMNEFLEAHSFRRAEQINLRGQISEHIFASNGGHSLQWRRCALNPLPSGSKANMTFHTVLSCSVYPILYCEPSLRSGVLFFSLSLSLSLSLPQLPGDFPACLTKRQNERQITGYCEFNESRNGCFHLLLLGLWNKTEQILIKTKSFQ